MYVLHTFLSLFLSICIVKEGSNEIGQFACTLKLCPKEGTMWYYDILKKYSFFPMSPW